MSVCARKCVRVRGSVRVFVGMAQVCGRVSVFARTCSWWRVYYEHKRGAIAQQM